MIDINNIENLSLEEITNYFVINKDNLAIEYSDNKVKLELLFQRVKKILKDYDAFCDYIIKYIKPTFEFIKFASESPIFYKRGKVPTFFFSNIENEQYDQTLINDTYETIIENIRKNIKRINIGKSEKYIDSIMHEIFVNIYSSFLYYLESGNGTNLLYEMDLTNEDFYISEKEKEAVENMMEIEDSSGLAIMFFQLDNEGNPISEYSKNKCLTIAKNYSNIISTSKEKLTKVIMGVLKSHVSSLDEIIKLLVTNYEKLTGDKYDLLVINNNHIDIDETYNKIIRLYVNKLINSTYTKDEIKYMMIELMNAGFEKKEIDEFIPLVESKLFENKDEYLLLFYQVLLSESYAFKHNITVDYYYFNPFLYDSGGYDEETDTIRFYLYDEEAMEDHTTIYEGMETAYHEVRHAYQYKKMMHKISFPAFLNDLERVITDKYDEINENNEHYKSRYEDVYYERDARVRSFYETFNKLLTFNNESVRDYVKSKMKSNEQDEYGINDWSTYALKDFYEDKKLLNGEETFMFLIQSLYELYSLQEIASMRNEFETFEIVMHEDGTLLSKEELREKMDTCIKYDEYGYPTDESIHTRGFIYTMLNMYEKCPNIQEIVPNSRH